MLEVAGDMKLCHSRNGTIPSPPGRRLHGGSC